MCKTLQNTLKTCKKNRLTESIFSLRHTFFGTFSNFLMAERDWKTQVILEDVALPNRRKRQMKMFQKQMRTWPRWGLSWSLIHVLSVRMISVLIGSPNHSWQGTTDGKNVCTLVPKVLNNEQNENQKNLNLNTTKLRTIFSNVSCQVKNCRFWEWSWNQTTKFRVVCKQLTISKGSKDKPIKNETLN